MPGTEPGAGAGALTLGPAREEELAALTDLCLRSKAVWGYDAAFMAACVAELTLTPRDLAESHLAVARMDGRVVGLVQVETGLGDGREAELEKIFVEPDTLGAGIGRMLFDWAVAEARAAGARRLSVDADPGAAPFYRRMGARDIGTAPSGSIPGRVLPRLSLELTGPDGQAHGGGR